MVQPSSCFRSHRSGSGTSEGSEHVLATQTLPQRLPKTMAVEVNGVVPPGVTAKDITLAIIGRLGTGGGIGHVIEYRGSAIEALSMEGRMTLCNMSIEAGARAGLVAPDDVMLFALGPKRQGPGSRRCRLRRGRRGLALAKDRRRRKLRHRHHPRRRRDPPARDVGHEPRSGDPDRWSHPRPFGVPRLRRARGGRARASLHGPSRRHCDRRRAGRHRVHRLVHEQQDRGPPTGRERCVATDEKSKSGACALIVPGCAARQGPGRGRGARQDIS